MIRFETSNITRLDMDLEELIGMRIKYLREDKNMTQKDLASLAKITRPTVALLEAGKFSARIDTLYAVTRSLDVSLSKIFRYAEDEVG
jgi:transcriptional regulator with XRE-family HTH domain